MINESERDDSLFGSTLSDRIKAAKAIEKQGLSIKKPVKPHKPTALPSSTRSSYQGNWNAPPRYPANRGGRGGYNRRLPTTLGPRRPYTASAQSQRTATKDKPRAPAQAHH
ncbi:jg17277 [Pararge aegeria aegeria]|uniref:Jg17277 protein n=1 Tax=Pararge aegeria aegeria TaxID=348720 RepID=A0A8S4QZ83_9NEOP|nr:jg17277 [Pararge aegeria aegeria]